MTADGFPLGIRPRQGDGARPLAGLRGGSPSARGGVFPLLPPGPLFRGTPPGDRSNRLADGLREIWGDPFGVARGVMRGVPRCEKNLHA